MPIYKNVIRSSVTKAVNSCGVSVPKEELTEIITTALYDVLSSAEFKRYIAELSKK